jgi:hypothetical protein
MRHPKVRVAAEEMLIGVVLTVKAEEAEAMAARGIKEKEDLQSLTITMANTTRERVAEISSSFEKVATVLGGGQDRPVVSTVQGDRRMNSYLIPILILTTGKATVNTTELWDLI